MGSMNKVELHNILVDYILREEDGDLKWSLCRSAQDLWLSMTPGEQRSAKHECWGIGVRVDHP